MTNSFLSFDTPLFINNMLTTPQHMFGGFSLGWTDTPNLEIEWQTRSVRIKRVFVGETDQLVCVKGTNGFPLVVSNDSVFLTCKHELIPAKNLTIGTKLLLDKTCDNSRISPLSLSVSDYLDDLWVQGYKLRVTERIKNFYGFETTSDKRYNAFNSNNQHKSFPLTFINTLCDEDIRIKPEEEFVKTKESKTKGSIPNNIKLTEDFGRFLGLYYAEGHNSNGELGFSFNCDEKLYIDFVTRFAQDVLRVKSTVRTFERKGVQVCLYSKTLGVLLDTLVGKYATGKILHPCVFDSPVAFREGLLRGIIEGDGCCNKWKCEITTTSKMGAFSIGHLAKTLGVSSTIKEYAPRTDEKRNIKGKHVIYTVSLNKNDIVVNRYNFGKTEKLHIPKTTMVKANHVLIKAVKPIQLLNKQRVCGFELEDDCCLYTLPTGLVLPDCKF